MAGRTNRPGFLATVRRVQLRQPILGILAGGSILFRSVPDLASTLSHLELLGPVFLSIITNSVYETPIGEIAAWLLYIYIVYEFTPRFFPGAVRSLVSNRGFKILFTIMTLAAAVALTVLPAALADLSQWLGVGHSTTRRGTSSIFLFVFMASIVLLGPRIFLYYFGYICGRMPNKYLPRKKDWQFEPIPKKLAEYLTIIHRDINYQSVESVSLTPEEVWKLGSISYMGTCIFPALGIVVISKLYPLPEIIVLIGITVNIYKRFAPPHQEAILDQLLVKNKERAVDVEEHIFLVIGKTQHSLIGQAILVLVLTGLAFSSLMFTEGFQITRNIGINLHTTALFHLSAATALVIAATYGVWYWISVLLRLSSFVKWREERGTNKKFPNSSEGSIPARPGGVMVPPILLTIIATVWWILPGLANPFLYLLAWSFTIGITVWMVWKSIGAQPQPPEADMWSIPLAWAIHCLGAIVVFWVFTMDARPALPMLGFVLVGPVIYARGELNVYTRNRSGYRYYLDVAFQTIVSLYWFGVLFALVSWFQSSYILNISFALAGTVTLRDAARLYRYKVSIV